MSHKQSIPLSGLAEARDQIFSADGTGNRSQYPPTLTGGEGQKPLSVVRSQYVISKGKLVEHMVRTGTAGNQAFIDQLTFVVERATCKKLVGGHVADGEIDSQAVFDACAVILSHYLEQIFGFGISACRHKSANFYEQSYALGCDKVHYGIVAIGGNKGTICVELTATGLAAAKDGWEHRLYAFANLPEVVGFRFTRVDIARDFFQGEYTVDKALAAYHADGFTLSITKPYMRKEGMDWDNDTRRGRTLYIGTRQSSRLVRIYEKGKQFGDEESPWTRVELELRSRDLTIPVDVLLYAGDYLTTYPAFANEPLLATEQPKSAEVKKRAIQSSIEHAVKYLRIQGSRAVRMLREHGKSAEQILTVFDPDAPVPDKLHPGRYFCQLLGIDYLHLEPDVIPV